jgi:adenine-specific DNA-methyltransferase
MNDIHTIQPDSPAFEDRLRILKETIPECFSEGRLDPDKLREALGEENLDSGPERYGLSWPGKREARSRAFKPSNMALHLAPGEGVNEKDTKNLIIEGENLEVLRLLQKSYRGRVKMIYIDPPYNTGNDFVYDDKFAESPLEYEKRTGLRAEDGSALQSNRKSSGRYHSNWLSMMYPRLILAKQLLTDDGVIFISIDDNELNGLVSITDEVFGEENKIGCITVISNLKGRSDDKFFATAHNYLLVYAGIKFSSNGVPLPDEYWDDYPEISDDGRHFRLQGLRKRGSGARRIDRPNMFFPIFINSSDNKVSTNKDSFFSIEVLPKLSDGEDGRWRWGKDTVDARKDELIAGTVGQGNRWDVFQVDFAENVEGMKRIKPKTVWSGSEFSNEAGNLELKKFLGKGIFDTTKPVGLVSYCLEQLSGADSIILDFFAGSGTTAQAVLALN